MGSVISAAPTRNNRWMRSGGDGNEDDSPEVGERASEAGADAKSRPFQVLLKKLASFLDKRSQEEPCDDQSPKYQFIGKFTSQTQSLFVNTIPGKVGL